MGGAATLCGLAAVILLFHSFAKRPVSSAITPEAGPVDVHAAAAPSEGGQTTNQAPVNVEPASVEDLVAFIRQFAARGGNANDLYRQIAAMHPQGMNWWRSASDHSALLDLATDLAVASEYRVVAMGIYLAGASESELQGNSERIQKFAVDAEDAMVTTVLQGMAERSLAPQTLVEHALSSQQRGTGPKCYAWYAARLTQPKNLAYARFAIAPQKSDLTEASKVGFDYLANTSFAEIFSANPELKDATQAVSARMKAIPPEAGPIEVANADAFIRAIPHIMETDTAIDALLSMLNEANHPEMRLSALEQLASLHMSGAKNLSEELHEIRNRTAELFPDPVKQLRAKKRLNRATSAEGLKQ
jgi:hypothetical protein